MSEYLFGGIEAGGTKFNCIVGSGPGDIRAKARIATTTPERTLAEVVAFFASFQERTGETIDAVGIASFGPVDLKSGSPTFGYITATPKPDWSNTDFAGRIQRDLGVPVGFDTDVNGAGLGEYVWGAGRGCEVFVYLTIGTGIGGGVLINGVPLHGLVHTEMGHIPMPRDSSRDPYEGCCPFHGDCLQGLASGKAMGLRWNTDAEELPATHAAWELEAEYLAAAVCTFSYTLSPERIILGGGVMEQAQLIDEVRRMVAQRINGYIKSSRVLDEMDQYVVLPGLGSRSGVLGAICLANQALVRANGC